jgi:hypothetical protein
MFGGRPTLHGRHWIIGVNHRPDVAQAGEDSQAVKQREGASWPL